MRYNIEKARKLAKLGKKRYVIQYGVVYCSLIIFVPVFISRFVQFRGINQYNLLEILILFLICVVVGYIIGIINWHIIVDAEREHDR